MTLAPTFATPPGFLGVAGPAGAGAGPTERGRPFSVVGIPLDLGTTNRAGARDGPAAIRRASRMLCDGDHPTHRIEPATLVEDRGDFAIALGDLAGSLGRIEAQARDIPHLVALGGEHGITLPLLRALRARHDTPLGLLQFDAHCDTWGQNFGQVFAHGAVFLHAVEEGLVDPARLVQVGIRSPIDRETWDWTVGRGVTVIDAMAVHEAGPAAIAAQVRALLGDAPCYLSFDIDALDPAAAPGTGTPEVGGLASWQAQSILRRLGGLRWIGMDVVEVAPAYDHAEITALAAATIAWEYIALVGASRD